MSKVHVIHRADGGVSLTRIPDSVTADDVAKFTAEVVSRWSACAAASELPIQAQAVVDESSLPASRRWRNAWVLSAGSLQVDLVRARTIRKSELQQRVQEAVAILNDKISAAEDGGDNQAAKDLRAQRKKVRDPALIDVSAVATLADLDAFSPADLQV